MSNFFKSENMQKIKRFFKKQGYYILLGFCVILVATVITLSVVLAPKDNVPTGNMPDDGLTGGDDGGGETPIVKKTFLLPIGGEYEVFNGWQTVGNFNQYCNHVSFSAEKGDNIIASADGIVSSAKIKGDSYVLEVFYTNQKLLAVYRGLDGTSSQAGKLKTGDVVSQGSVLGVVKGDYVNIINNAGNAVEMELFSAETYDAASREEVADIMSKFVAEDK